MISVIIVNWNGVELLGDCLTSVQRQDCDRYEIILVDNGSSDGSAAFVRERFPQAVVVALEHNSGFAGGNIEGLQRATGDYILLLNNDARLADGFLSAMLQAMDSDHDLGMCASKIIVDGTDSIDSVGDLFTTAFSGTKVGLDQPEQFFCERRFLHGACAAAAVYRRSMLDEIGFLDRDFFLNHEDTDLNLRAWLAGWKCLFVPQAVAYHKVSRSIGNLSDTSVYYFSRNVEWVWIKNVPLWLMLRFLPQRILYGFTSFVYYCILKGRWRAYIKGKVDALAGLPAMLKKRRAVQRLVRLSPAVVSKELLPLCRYLKSRVDR